MEYYSEVPSSSRRVARRRARTTLSILRDGSRRVLLPPLVTAARACGWEATARAEESKKSGVVARTSDAPVGVSVGLHQVPGAPGCSAERLRYQGPGGIP